MAFEFHLETTRLARLATNVLGYGKASPSPNTHEEPAYLYGPSGVPLILPESAVARCMFEFAVVYQSTLFLKKHQKSIETQTDI